MARYLVMWEVDIFDARSPRHAAQQAFDMMQREGTTATCFKVIEHDTGGWEVAVDLMDPDEPTAG